MKHYRYLTITFILLMFCMSVRAADFTVDGICYNILSTDDKTVEVTSGGNYLRNIEIPATVTYNSVEYSVKSIGDKAFDGRSYLTSVIIPNSVTSIGAYAFFLCKGLTSITIPNSVTSIGSNAFAECSKLTSITIPESVTYIAVRAFGETAWLNNQPDGLVYAGKVAYLYKGTMPANTSIELEDGTLGIAGGAFCLCSGLTSITIPNSVTSIGNDAFCDCSGLTSISIPNSVTSLGGNAFYGCSSLTSVTIPNSVTSIGGSAFSGCI